ncbi:MAG: polysaccharide deacetylase family protein [Acidimicrobiales bacterium]
MRSVGAVATVLALGAVLAGCGGLRSTVSTTSMTRPVSPTTSTSTTSTTTSTTTTTTTTVPSPASGCPTPDYGPNFYAPTIPSGGKTVALTFDDGPGASTATILSILEAYGVRATFFNIGEQEAEWPSDVKAEAQGGFLIGNHTWNHPDMTKRSTAEQASELDKVTAEQKSLVGTSPCVFRPPYGDYNSTTLSLAQARHMAVWMWSVDTEDWEAEGSSSSYWVNRIVSLAESEGGALQHPVVEMHNQAVPMPATVAALPIVIKYFESHGYTFVDLLGRTGPPTGDVSSG